MFMKSNMPPTSKTSHPHSAARSGSTTPRRNATYHPASPSPRAGRRILLVDDDPTVRGSLKELLVGEGYFVISADSTSSHEWPLEGVIGNLSLDDIKS